MTEQELLAKIDRLEKLLTRYRPIYTARRITGTSPGGANSTVAIDEKVSTPK